MPAYFDTGFSVREPMWHGEGLVLDEYPADWTEARRLAGLEWEPVARPLAVEVTAPEITEDGVTPATYQTLDSHQAITRSDTGAILGVVSDGYQIVDHGVMGEILDALVGSGDGTVKFETAGSCRGGAQVWALAYLDEPYEVVGDDSQTYPFLALLNSHDGTGACKVVSTQVRVVCWNTYRAAEMEGERTGRTFTFRHTGKVMDRIADAKAALAGLRQDAHDWQALAADLFAVRATDRAVDVFLSEFIPEPVEDVISDRVRANIAEARKRFRSIYDTSVTTEAHRGTALGLVDSAVEYLDHARTFRSRDTYMGRTLLRPEPLKQNLVRLSLDACTA